MKRLCLLFLAVALCLAPAAALAAPANVASLMEKGVEDCNNGKFDEAIAKFNQAMKMQPDDPALYVLRGRAKYAKGLNSEALADLTQAVKINPNFAQAYNTRAQVNFTMEDFHQALADLQKAQSLGFKVDADYLRLVQKRVREKQK
jgi:tetratricopeptide (TPR) repeat protein